MGTTNLQQEDSAEPVHKSDNFKDSSNHTFSLVSNERRMKLAAKNKEQLQQFISSIEGVVAKTVWKNRNRFDSFAPVRTVRFLYFLLFDRNS